MKNDKGLVFNIQRYSIHDGAGIRTLVFFKGCPLMCPWCSNPESRLAVRPTTWVKDGKVEQIGEWYTVDEIVKEVMKDEIFYRTSGGGVTLSGGEILMQHKFAKKLLQRLQHLGIHTAIETTGCFRDRFKELLPYCDQVLFDLKIMNSNESRRIIGADIEVIKENFEIALKECRDGNVELTPRVPLIPGYTYTYDNVVDIANYLLEVGVNSVHLLPFHQYGSSKYEYLGWEYQLKDVPTLKKGEISGVEDIFNAKGIETILDGLE